MSKDLYVDVINLNVHTLFINLIYKFCNMEHHLIYNTCRSSCMLLNKLICKIILNFIFSSAFKLLNEFIDLIMWVNEKYLH